MAILAAAAFAVQSTYHRTKEKSPGQLVFGRDMILPINCVADWRYIRQQKKSQIDKDITCENTTITDNDYRVVDEVMKKTKSVYIYETLFKVPYGIVHTWKNGTITLRMGAVTMRINIRNAKPYNTPIVEGRKLLQEV